MTDWQLKKLSTFPSVPGPVITCVMDGVGIGKRDESDAVFLARTPNLDWLQANALYTTLNAHGVAVGMPSNADMGNSEVGHNALGAGRIYDQGAKLVQNAVDASPVGGVVLVHGRVNESVLTVRVTDQGEGVPPELRERIFEPFFTTKNASVKTSGMGLGLTMVSRSVAAAGGEIIVADAQGGGAEFSVTLPLTDQGVTS